MSLYDLIYAIIQRVNNALLKTDTNLNEDEKRQFRENIGITGTGADGTPATHRWSGTTLYITSASGTSSANLKGEKGDPGTNGKDGYTPIKGVDYHDGIDGKDGYTPVKNVDYFDGKDGTDGYTPVKGIDYFDGQPGEPGKDYVLTEADKTDIAEIAADMVDIPKSAGFVVQDTAPNDTSVMWVDPSDNSADGFEFDFTETDPTVPAWAKASTKPSYTKSEVGLGNVDNVKQYSANNPPPYPVTSVNGKTGAVTLDASAVGARPDNWMPSHSDVGADKSGTATTAVSTHNTNTDAHNDIRLELKAINDRLNAFFDSDNQTLDELSEIVAYITNNKTLIDNITTSKVNVADIINNLTTNVSNKPLSSAQGVVLKGLIDTVSNSLSGYQPKGDYALKSELPTKVSQLTNDKNYLTAVPSEYVTETELTAKGYITGYTETDPTVPSWAKATSKPSYTASEVGAVPTGRKVNNKALSSDITLSASDVSAVPTTRKVNGKALSSDITLSASDVGALPSTTAVPSKTETWTFTLADGSTVTKAVYVG